MPISRSLSLTGKLTPARLRYCFGLALSTAAGVALSLSSALGNGYWIPMTVLLVLRWAGLRATLGRAIARGGGTLLGAGIVTVIVALARPGTSALVALGLLAAWACYALQWVNYALFSIVLTAFVVLGFAVAGLPEPVVALHRTLATLEGGALAILGQIILRTLEPDRHKRG